MEMQIAAGIIVSLFATTVFTQTPPANNECANASEIHLGAASLTNIDATTLTLSQIQLSISEMIVGIRLLIAAWGECPQVRLR